MNALQIIAERGVGLAMAAENDIEAAQFAASMRALGG